MDTQKQQVRSPLQFQQKLYSIAVQERWEKSADSIQVNSQNALASST